MIRTQVRLDEVEYKLAKKEARALGISVAEFVRRAIRQSLAAAAGASWMRYAGFVESGHSRSSQFVDEIVYGETLSARHVRTSRSGSHHPLLVVGRSALWGRSRFSSGQSRLKSRLRAKLPAPRIIMQHSRCWEN
jgi:hypothetical protein